MKLRRRLIIIFCIVFLIFCIRILYTNRNQIFLGRNVNRGGQNIIYKVDGAVQRNFSNYKDLLLINTNQLITAINTKGSVVWSINFTTKNPMLNVNNNYILIADRGGSEFMTVKNGKIISQVDVGGDISTAKVNSRGYVAVATTEWGYKSKIVVYNPYGVEVYNWKLSDNYVIDCEVSPKGDKLAAALFSTSEEKIFGSLAFVDIKNEKIIEQPSFLNCIFSAIHYNSNGKLLAVSDVAAMYYNQKGQSEWNVNFQGRTLQSYSYIPGNNLLMFFQNSRNTSTLESYSMDGKLRKNLELGYEIKNLSETKGTIVACGTRDLGIYNNKGSNKALLTLNSDVRWQGIMPNKRDVYVVHGNSIDVIRP